MVAQAVALRLLGDGGRNAGSLLKKRDPGAGTGGHSYVNPTVE